jgi:hypothetical protein
VTAVVLRVCSKRLSEVSSKGASVVTVMVDDTFSTTSDRDTLRTSSVARLNDTEAGAKPCTVVETV